MREPLRGGLARITGANESLTGGLVHARSGIGSDDFPQIVRHKAPTSGEPMSASVFGGTQTVSSVDVKPKMSVGLSALMADQFAAPKIDNAIRSVTIRRSDVEAFTHHHRPTQRMWAGNKARP